MRSRAVSVIGLSCAAWVLLAATQAVGAGNAVSDGGFETPADGTGVVEYTQGSTMGSWLVGPGNVDHVGSSLWTPSEGAETVDLNAADVGGLSQLVAVPSRSSLQLHFAVAGNLYGPPAVKALRVKFGAVRRTVKFDTTGKTTADMGWVCPTFAVTAGPGSSTKLSFVSLTTNSGGANWYGPVIDDVRLLDPAAPTVTRIGMREVRQGTARSVKVYGTNFVSGAAVEVSGTGVTVTRVSFVSPAQLNIRVRVAPDAPAEARAVTVTNPDASADTCGKPLMVNAGTQPGAVSGARPG